MLTDDCPDAFDQIFDLRRVCIAGRIGQSDLVATGLHQGLSQRNHALRRHDALEGATKRRRQSAFELRSLLGRQAADQLSDLPRLLDHLRVGTSHILQAMGLGGRQRNGDFVRTRSDGRLGTLKVRHQHRDGQPRNRASEGHHLGRVGQLR